MCSLIILLAHSFLLAGSLRAAAGLQWTSDCGPNGFVCVGRSRLRLCTEGSKPSLGPAFLCPRGLQCDEQSPGVCEDASALDGPGLRGLHCRRGERVPDPQVDGCRGYVLCISRGQRLTGIRFTCIGDTVFNPLTRTCTALAAYRCPPPVAPSPSPSPAPLQVLQDEVDGAERAGAGGSRPVDCKDYKLRAAHEGRPQLAQAAYFCPSRPVRPGAPLLCTVFSEQFCVMLERDVRDLHALGAGRTHRTPRRRTRTHSTSPAPVPAPLHRRTHNSRPLRPRPHLDSSQHSPLTEPDLQNISEDSGIH